MPRILIKPGQSTRYANLYYQLQERKYEVAQWLPNQEVPNADLALLDLTGRDISSALAEFNADSWPVDLPVLILADTPPKTSHHLTVAGWLTAPFEALEVIGAVRAALNARAAMNGQGDLATLRAQLLSTERERDDYESADQKKDEFISYISHELKNPMASIKGYSDLMRRRLNKAPDDPNRKGLEIISAQVGRMTLLLDQLLDFSRISMDRLQLDIRKVDLVHVVERLIEESQPMTDRHALQLVVNAQPLVVLGDENRLRQAMQYVLGNAIKFSPAPSTIVLTLSKNGNRDASVAVSDKGIGIPFAEQQSIFERFVRASNVDEQTSGMGLGLFLAKELIARHNGQIAVESAPGEGSTFTLTLPLVT